MPNDGITVIGDDVDGGQSWLIHAEGQDRWQPRAMMVFQGNHG